MKAPNLHGLFKAVNVVFSGGAGEEVSSIVS